MSKYRSFKKKVYEIVSPHEKKTKFSIIFDIVLSLLVFLSCIAVIIELFNINDELRYGLETFEYITVGIFIVEYLIRIWVSEFEFPECENKLKACWEYITSFYSLIDILSILSILFNQIPKEFAVLRLVKLIKLVRLVKINDYIGGSNKVHDKTEKIKIRINEIIDKGKEGDIISKIYDIFTVCLVLISVSFILIETFPLTAEIHHLLFVFEVIIAVFFAIEYVLRVWTAPCDYPEIKKSDKARMKYIFSFMSLVDLLSIVPVFVANLPTTMGIFKIFKLCKIIRLVKVSRYLKSIANFGYAIKLKKKQIIFSMVAIAILIVISSILMYSFEHPAQPEVFVNGLSGVKYCFLSIFNTESSISPVTPIGQGLSTVMLLLGGCMLGVPLAIISTGFGNMIDEQAGEEQIDKNIKLHKFLEMYDQLSDEDQERFNKLLNEHEE